MVTVPDGAVQLPLRIEDLSARWLTDVLSIEFPGTEVSAISVLDVLWGTATKVRLSLRYSNPEQSRQMPSSVVVKAAFNPANRELLEFAFACEVRFYRDFLPRLTIETPRCLFAADDSANRQHLLILEDLNLRNVQFCRVQTPLSYEDTQKFLDTLAIIHSKWWGIENCEPGGALASLRHRDPFPAADQFQGRHAHRQLEPDNWNKYINLPRGVALPRVARDRDVMRRALTALSHFSHTGPMCLLHGDPHLGNLYHDALARPGVLDWQGLTYGSWSHDVTYFMVSALDIRDCREWSKPLLAYYLERLAHHGVHKPPTFTEAWEAFRLQVIDGLFYWLVNTVDMQAEENNCAVAPRFAAAALDMRTFELID
jgi:hypothetical protein